MESSPGVSARLLSERGTAASAPNTYRGSAEGRVETLLFLFAGGRITDPPGTATIRWRSGTEGPMRTAKRLLVPPPEQMAPEEQILLNSLRDLADRITGQSELSWRVIAATMHYAGMKKGDPKVRELADLLTELAGKREPK
jgi:hypothetical protein